MKVQKKEKFSIFFLERGVFSHEGTKARRKIGCRLTQINADYADIMDLLTTNGHE